jgi:ATP/maltotriose-dependent transcriptional regulator MalT
VTTEADILGRPPARFPQPLEASEHESESDWRGEDRISVRKCPKRSPLPRPSPMGEPKRLMRIRVAHRREKVLKLYRQGLSAVQIGDALGVSADVARNDLAALGLWGGDPRD